MKLPQLQSIVVVDISVMAQRQIPMVVEFLQLQYIDKVVDVVVLQVSLHARCVQRQMPMVDYFLQFIDWVAVAVMPQRPVPAVGLISWNEGQIFWGLAHRCRAGGRVHRDTASTIRCIQLVCMDSFRAGQVLLC